MSAAGSPAAGFRSALRLLADRLPEVRPVAGAPALLEQLPGDQEPPHLMDAEVLEDATLRARPVPGDPEPGFAAFLDGTQRSRVLGWAGPAPVVYGEVAAAIRVRVERRLVAWGTPLIERHLYAPLPYVPAGLTSAFAGALDVVDTARADADGALPARHPALLLERAKVAVSRDREMVERRLAERWCDAEGGTLLVDGGLGASEALARTATVVGLVKTHRTLFVSDEALDTLAALPRGARTSAFRITTGVRAPVRSWYLRLREPAGHDVLWGLVRVETADDASPPTARADAVSRWILAESAPLAVPDARWDRLLYGVWNAEQTMRAVL